MATLPTVQAVPPHELPRQYKPLTPGQLSLRRFRRNPLAVIGLLVVLIFIVAGVLAPVISPFPYDKTDLYTT